VAQDCIVRGTLETCPTVMDFGNLGPPGACNRRHSCYATGHHRRPTGPPGGGAQAVCPRNLGVKENAPPRGGGAPAEVSYGMSKKLFAGGLSWNTNDEGLRQAFEQFGEISEAKVITDRDTGRSRGFGFITFVNGEDADRAVAEMDGAELDGRTIRVNEAQAKKPGGGGGGRGRGRY
jgi:cold-inducible RNA-binding protein